MGGAVRFSRSGLLAVLLLLGWRVPSADASLIKMDFLTAGDGFLVSDTVTQLEWLTPFYTRGHLFNDAFVQGVIGTHGFRYATAAETLAMINSNFGNPTVGFPGDAAGFAAASAFFNIFGINDHVRCGQPLVPCPRTQGLTADVGSFSNTHLAFGMIQFGTNGWLITNNSWSDSSADPQMGSWLVRAPQSTVPEPGSISLVVIGLAGFGARRWFPRRRS